jgi:hypothetical protein
MATKNDIYKVSAVSSQGKTLVRNVNNFKDAVRVGTDYKQQHCNSVEITTYQFNHATNRYEVKQS